MQWATWIEIFAIIKPLRQDNNNESTPEFYSTRRRVSIAQYNWGLESNDEPKFLQICRCSPLFSSRAWISTYLQRNPAHFISNSLRGVIRKCARIASRSGLVRTCSFPLTVAVLTGVLLASFFYRCSIASSNRRSLYKTTLVDCREQRYEITKCLHWQSLLWRRKPCWFDLLRFTHQVPY
jgi:hypothetical protein